jgi:hypothetical protein
MGKAIIISVFSLVCVWGISHFISMGHVVFMAAGMPVNSGMLFFAAAVGISYKMIGR